MSDYTIDKEKLAAAVAAATETRKLMAAAFGCLQERAAHLLDGTGVQVLVEESIFERARCEYSRLARVVSPRVYVDELETHKMDEKLDELFSAFRKEILSLSPRSPEELVCCTPFVSVHKEAYMFEFYVYTVVDLGGVKVDAYRDSKGCLVRGVAGVGNHE